ncbi:hypothetical protein BFF78_28285 [Streptomyces fodineus]|uniref:LD-carboxypeptidase C-terminal domain-containing protein n=1 Tax=Streptomyces fodineus TaxID=1904616 RepID=A0A1D7YFZ3_9ACTN|nr:hypothetical protein BFF78_28285 [Streptomyces fodineus]
MAGRLVRHLHADHPADPRDLTLDAEGAWSRLDGDADVDVEGRLIGGCIETIGHLAGAPYLDTSRFAGDEPLLVYVEACEDNAFTICRHLHGMLPHARTPSRGGTPTAGFFDRAAAVLVGRTRAPDGRTLTRHQAVLDALGPLGVPIVADVECGHVAPYLPLVNGARGRVVHTAARSEIVQIPD